MTMKAKPGFRIANICGVNILIAEGKENLDFSKVISMNDSAAMLWERVQDKEFTIDDLAKILTDNYEKDNGKPLSYQEALTDAKDISEQWLKAEIITLAK